MTVWDKSQILTRMNTITALLDRIADHCSRVGIAETTFGLYAVNDGKIVPRLRAGGSVTLRTVEKIEAALSASVAGGIPCALNDAEPPAAPHRHPRSLPAAASSGG